VGESSTTRTPLVVTNKTWLISDTHFGHKNIIKFQQRPESHEAIMLSEWINAVGEHDDILHLGDVFMGKQGNPARWASIISRLPGRKYLIIGNHDGLGYPLYERAGFTIIPEFQQGEVVFTHRPITKMDVWALTRPEWTTNIHGHIHGNTLTQNPDDPEDQYVLGDKRYINLSVEVTDYKPVRLGNVFPLQKSPKRGS
jgi:calcineurin-like phosphoesterase family protein